MVCGGIGTALAVVAGVLIVKRLVFRMIMRRRGFSGGGYGGYGGCGSRSHFSGHSRGFGGMGGMGGWGGRGPRTWLRSVFARLETTPSQEKVIVAAVTELREIASRARSRAPEVRDDVARAIRSDVLDEAALGAAQAKVDIVTSEVRIAFAEALRKIHEVLDDKQRAMVADLLSRGRGFFGGDGGPYRTVSL